MERGPIIFLGTGEFAVPLLEELVAGGEEVRLVVTQPERPRGRGRKPAPTPVGVAAQKLGLQIATPDSVNDPAFVERMRALAPQFLALADYGQFLRDPVLTLAPGGAVNLHPSLLPRWRGPAPIAWPLLEGEETTGATVMLMDKGMDTGPLLAQVEYRVGHAMTAGELSEALAEIGARLFCQTLDRLRKGEISPVPQDERKATLSKMVGRDWMSADFTLPPEIFAQRVNGLSPRPGVRAQLNGKLVKFLRAESGAGRGAPGEILATGAGGIAVACGEGAVNLLEVLPEGRKEMKAAEYANGGGAAKGMVFTPFVAN